MAGPAHTLSLSEDTAPAGARYRLAALNRVLYVRAGGLTVTSAGRDVAVAADAAWHGPGACEVAAGASGATVLRWELVRTRAAITGAPAGVTVRMLLEHPIDLDPRAAYLMRCDRVDFAPGGQALPHRHRGGGIRCLVAGALDVTVGDAPIELA